MHTCNCNYPDHFLIIERKCTSVSICFTSFLFISAKPLGLVVATSEDTLKSIRPQVDQYTQDDDDDGQRQLAKSWRFLDGELGRSEREREREGGGEERRTKKKRDDIHAIFSRHLSLFPFAVATTGRVDRMFQVLPDQEDSISLGDILSDGLLVVELDTGCRLQAIPETPTNPQILFSPEEEVK